MLTAGVWFILPHSNNMSYLLELSQTQITLVTRKDHKVKLNMIIYFQEKTSTSTAKKPGNTCL